MPTWASLTLCTPDDIRDTLTDLETFLQVREGSSVTADLTGYIASAKDAIRDRLLSDIPDFFAAKNVYGYTWEYYISYVAPTYRTYDELDTILDKLSDSTVLKRAAIAYSIIEILRSGSAHFTTRPNDMLEWYAMQMDYWGKEADHRYKMARVQLAFDLDESGDIQDTERVRARVSFRRV